MLVAAAPSAAQAARAGLRSATAPSEPAYGRRADLMRFAADVAQRRELPLEWLASQLAKARRVDAVRRLVMPAPAGTLKNWATYRARFIEPARIDAGTAFWRDNEVWLQRAEQRWGVPAEIVVGIVGVETYYGRLTGHFRTLDALATLAFDFPSGREDRSAFFRAELEEFFVLCARAGSDPQELRGSYAGAMGLPQFMPGSVNRYAVDFDGDGRIDLLGSAADVTGSVAHYLAEFGWQRGVPTHFEVTAPTADSDLAALLAPDIVPGFTVSQFASFGAGLDATGRVHSGPLALVELRNGPAPPSYVAGTANFYALTRYNRSSYYAMAVIELGQAVAARRTRSTGAAAALNAAPVPQEQ
jgi:membrane-bound lytic murein transglycosylase B